MNTALWIDVGAAAAIPSRGARRFMFRDTPIAVFRAGDGGLFALIDRCPHKGGPLSEGIVHARSVTCPLHNWVISLETGNAQGSDSGCTHALPVEARDGQVFVDVGALSLAASA